VIGVRADPYLDIETYEGQGDVMVLNMGPQHPSTHGVLRLKLWLDGEVVVKAVPYLGYLHRGVEKLLEKLTYVQSTPIVDKNDYVSSMTNELALVMAFEKLEGCEIPRRARYIRTICAEMQRVASHLLWLGTFSLDMGGALGGGTTAFMYCLRERELILDLFEELSGARFHYHMMQVGGVRHDLPQGWDARLKSVAAAIGARIPEYESMLSEKPDLPRAHARRRAHRRAAGAGAGHLGPEPARLWRRLRPAQGAALRCLRRDRGAHGARLRRRRLRTLPGAPRGDAREPAHRDRADRRGARGADHGPQADRDRQRGQAARGRGLCGDRQPARRTGRLGGQRRLDQALPLQAAPALLPRAFRAALSPARHDDPDVVVILGSLDPIMGEADR